MDKVVISYEDFLREVNPEHLDFYTRADDLLLSNGCKIKIEQAKSGYVVSYSHTKSKRVAINYVFRKNAVFARIYAEKIGSYMDFLENLPEQMLAAIDKAAICKRLHDPEKCNARCPKGYDFTVKGTHYMNCRYGAFMFEINNESVPFIFAFIENEIRERNA